MNGRGITLRRYLTQPTPSTVKSASRANTDQQAREVFEQLEPPRSYRSCPDLCFFIRNSDLEPLDGSHSRDTMRSIITVSRVMELQTSIYRMFMLRLVMGRTYAKGYLRTRTLL